MKKLDLKITSIPVVARPRRKLKARWSVETGQLKTKRKKLIPEDNKSIWDNISEKV